MALLVGACGVVCSECGAYKAGRTQDAAERQRVAAAWRDIFKLEVAPDTLSCGGCLNQNEAAFASCQQCWVRQCVLSKGIAHCGLCESYPCPELERVQAQYDGLENMAETLSEAQFDEFVLPYCQVRERLAMAVRRPWDWS